MCVHQSNARSNRHIILGYAPTLQTGLPSNIPTYPPIAQTPSLYGDAAHTAPITTAAGGSTTTGTSTTSAFHKPEESSSGTGPPQVSLVKKIVNHPLSGDYHEKCTFLLLNHRFRRSGRRKLANYRINDSGSWMRSTDVILPLCAIDVFHDILMECEKIEMLLTKSEELRLFVLSWNTE